MFNIYLCWLYRFPTPIVSKENTLNNTYNKSRLQRVYFFFSKQLAKPVLCNSSIADITHECIWTRSVRISPLLNTIILTSYVCVCGDLQAQRVACLLAVWQSIWWWTAYPSDWLCRAIAINHTPTAHFKNKHRHTKLVKSGNVPTLAIGYTSSSTSVSQVQSYDLDKGVQN